MKIQTKQFATSLTILSLAGGFVSARPAQAQFRGLSEQEEIQAGQEVARNAIKEYGQPLSANDPRQQRVSRIGALFARSATRRNIPYSYTVLQNDKVLNAFAGPGGPIFVTTKLIATAQNDAELAYVLGHETGHIEEKHIVKAVQKQQTVGLAAGILGAIIGGRSKSGDVIGAVTNISYGLWQKGYSRSQESEADDYGTRAMARLGFDPRAAVSMLTKLGDGPEGIGKYLSDHPTSKARRERVSQLITSENLENVARQNGGGFLMLNGTSAGYAPSYSSAGRGNGSSNQTNNAPFTSRVVEEGGYRVVMAPVDDVVDFAGGQVRELNGGAIEVRRGGSSGVFQRDSNRATLSGRETTLAARSRRIDGQLYVPIGALANALGGSATYDQSRNAVVVSFGSNRETTLRL